MFEAAKTLLAKIIHNPLL